MKREREKQGGNCWLMCKVKDRKHGGEGFGLTKGRQVTSLSDYLVSCPPLCCFSGVLHLSTV